MNKCFQTFPRARARKVKKLFRNGKETKKSPPALWARGKVAPNGAGLCPPSSPLRGSPRRPPEGASAPPTVFDGGTHPATSRYAA